jgi:hypothetical protein
MKVKSPVMLLLAAGAVAAAMAMPAAASAGKLVRIDPHADPLAPTGNTPVVLFHVTGLTKGRQYVLHASQVSGQAPRRQGPDGPESVCSPVLGNGSRFVRARSHSLDWDTRPGYFVKQPELYEFDYPAFAPCTGAYKGRLAVKARYGTKTLVRFRITVPQLEMRYFRR